MYLKQLMDDMALNEFRQLFITPDAKIEIDVAHRREFVANTKMVLNEIFTRLNLRVGFIKVHLIADLYVYEIDPHRLLTSDSPLDHYLEDLDDFRNNYIQATRILVPDPCNAGEYLDAMDNVPNAIGAFRFLSHNRISTPRVYKDDHFIVEYRANHPEFSVEEAVVTPEQVWLELPPAVNSALRLGIASKKFGTVGMATTGTHTEKQSYVGMYYRELDNLMLQGHELPAPVFVDKDFHLKGWV